MSIVVFGSINMDLVARVDALPAPGETRMGYSFATVPGGKGANQAVACARLGAPTRMVGRVGGDAFGALLRDGLQAEGISVGDVLVDADQPSGIAQITVDARGENTIVVVPGANGAVGEADLERLDRALAGARVLLLQLEVPLASVVAAAERARRRGVTVLLDPAPAQPLPPALYALADLLTPNEHEAAAMVGFPLRSDDEIARAAALLLERGARQVLIKLGGRGAFWADAHHAGWGRPFVVSVVDTVAAGDACNAGLAVALGEGKPLAEALPWGLAAGALAVTVAGAQPALPRRAAVEALLAGGRG